MQWPWLGGFCVHRIQGLGQLGVRQTRQGATLREAMFQAMPQQADHQDFAQAIQCRLPSRLRGKGFFVDQSKPSLRPRQFLQLDHQHAWQGGSDRVDAAHAKKNVGTHDLRTLTLVGHQAMCIWPRHEDQRGLMDLRHNT
jgi:hypothetical protein